MSTKKEKTLDTKKKDLLLIDIRLIDIDPEYNSRADYGDMDELTDSIFLHGVQTPMMIRANMKSIGRYYLVRGHRRYKAVMNLFKANRIADEQLRVPCQTKPKSFSDVDLLVDQIVSNSGKPYTILETAEVIKRLLAFSISEKEVAKKLSKSITFVINLTKISSLPQEVKDMISNGRIKSTLVMDIFKTEKDFDIAIQKIRDANDHIISIGKEKITKKDIEKLNNKFNSYGFLKKMFRQNEKSEQPKLIREEKKELFEFTQKLLPGELTAQEIEDTFFDKGELVFDSVEKSNN